MRTIFLSVLFLFSTLSASVTAQELRLATTTSTEASGLLGVILPQFEKETGIKVRVISVGTGQALKLGERGDVDIVLVHSRPDEDKFMGQGFGSVRFDVMYNDFVIVGPPNDPAKIRPFKIAADALKAIAETKSRFISRGDDSGTHKKELSLWKDAGINPKASPKVSWYVEAGQGMGEVLTMAGNLQAYTLSDRGTYQAYRGRTGLEVLVSQVPGLFNPYGIMPVNPTKHPHVNHIAAMKFANWLVAPVGRAAIESLKIGGQSLFVPGAPPTIEKK